MKKSGKAVESLEVIYESQKMKERLRELIYFYVTCSDQMLYYDEMEVGDYVELVKVICSSEASDDWKYRLLTGLSSKTMTVQMVLHMLYKYELTEEDEYIENSISTFTY